MIAHGGRGRTGELPRVTSPPDVLSILLMRRLLASCLGLLLLTLGPVYPYIHLAAVPHYLCPEHGVFERAHVHAARITNGLPERAQESASRSDAPDTPPTPGSPSDSHETCTLASLTLASALSSHQTQPLSLRPAPQPSTWHSTLAPRKISKRWLLSLAPKASPPNADLA